MAKLYYGNGNCHIDANGVIAVEIRFKGTVSIDDKTPNNYGIMQKNNKIIIFPYGEVKDLSNLFDYEGEFKIISLIAADRDSEKVPISIERVLDYSEFINSNSEDMTTISEHLNKGYESKKGISNPNVKQKYIDNLDTNDNIEIYRKGGTIYQGKFKISLEDGTTMTPDGEELYYKAYGKLLSTKDMGQPPVSVLRRKASNKKQRNSVTTRQGSGRY